MSIPHPRSVLGDERPFELAMKSPGFQADPYPWYAEFRHHDPVHRTELGNWVVTGYDEVVAALSSPDLVCSQPPLAGATHAGVQGALRRIHRRWLPFVNGDEHGLLRGLLGGVLTPARFAAAIEGLTPKVEAAVRALATTERFDVMSMLADWVPFEVICEIFSIPDADRAQIAKWSFELARTLEPLASATRRVSSAAEATLRYSRRLAAERRARPGDDAASAILAAAEDRGLDDLDVASLWALVFGAAHHTTRNLIGNGLHSLLTVPGAWEQVVDDTELTNVGVEELARFDSPVQMVARVANSSEVSLAGRTIREGEHLLVFLGAANRDPSQFPDADSLDLHREPNRHVAFGRGLHACLGSAAAKLETRMVVSLLAGTIPRLRLADAAIRWRPRVNFRGPARLEVTPA